MWQPRRGAAEEERISIEKDNGSIGKECTEMTEFKNGIDKSKYDSSNSINQSKSLTVKSSKEMENNNFRLHCEKDFLISVAFKR